MLIVLSPAKTLDYATPSPTDFYTEPEFIPRSATLISSLKKMSVSEIGELMSISEPLSRLNATRYASWEKKSTTANAKQALLAFNGDVYEGLDAASLSSPQLTYLQSHLRILSGLYGLLRPLDLMQPYRLEMGTQLATKKGKNLYAFWGNTVTDTLNHFLQQQQFDTLVNLASEEYFKVVQPARLGVPVITPVFEDWKNGRYKIISFYAKRARGLMARFAAVNRITVVNHLRGFDSEGYAFDDEASDAYRWIFRRRISD